jgi:hypothetical protein
MARTTLTTQQIARTGVIHTFGAVDQPNGNQFLNVDERVFIYVKNASGGAVNVTIPTPITIDDLAVGDRVVNIAAGVNKLIGPFPRQYYNQTDGMVYIDYDTGTSVTIAVIRL